MPYLKKVFIALSTTEEEEYEEAMQLKDKIEVPCDINWCNKPQVRVNS
jgi:hypothetical protein